MADPTETEQEFIPWRMKRYKDMILHERSTEIDKFPDFEIRDDDVWVASYPRSGTTVTLEIVYLIQTLDSEKASNTLRLDLTPWFDVYDPTAPGYRGVKYVADMKSPRVIKTHLHYCMLPDQLKRGKGKIVYVSRNPNACALSYYKLTKFFKYCPAETLREWFEMFLQDDVFCCPWWLHVLQYWEHRRGNILMIRFDDLVKNKRGEIRMIAAFLGKSLTEDQVEQIAAGTEIAAMKANPNINFDHHEKQFKTDRSYGGFINEGSVDRWRQEVPGDLHVRVNQMVRNRLGHTDLQF